MGKQINKDGCASIVRVLACKVMLACEVMSACEVMGKQKRKGVLALPGC